MNATIRASLLAAAAAVYAGGACRIDENSPLLESDVPELLYEDCLPWRSMECPCTGQRFDGDRQCLPQQRGARSASQDLVYSSVCADALLTTVARTSEGSTSPFCSADPADYVWQPCTDECQIYSGDAALGAECDRYGRFMSTCKPGLVCGFDDRCYEPCDRPLEIPRGGTCGYDLGLLLEQCAGGLVCDAQSHSCVDELADGSRCTAAHSLCGPSSWCDPTSSECARRLGLGRPCRAHNECESLVCDGVCRPADPWGCAHPWF